MTLKELVMQTSFEEVTAEYKKTLHAHGIWFHEEEEQFLSNIFRKVKTIPQKHDSTVQKNAARSIAQKNKGDRHTD